MIYFKTISTIECFVRRTAISVLILISPWIFMIKILTGRDFFSKYFPYVDVFYVNYGQEFQISAQLLIDTIYNKRDQKREQTTRLYFVIRVKLMVFMALTNCFRKNFTDFFRFAFISYNSCSPMTFSVPNQRSS